MKYLKNTYFRRKNDHERSKNADKVEKSLDFALTIANSDQSAKIMI